MTDLSKAIERDPKYATAYNNRGSLFKKLGQVEKAKEYYTKAVELDPQNENFYDSIGYLYLDTDDNGSAVTNFIRCLEINNKNVDATLGLSIAYYNKGDLSNAKHYFEEARKLEQSLGRGMNSIKELEKLGYTDKNTEILKKMFQELK